MCLVLLPFLAFLFWCIVPFSLPDDLHYQWSLSLPQQTGIRSLTDRAHNLCLSSSIPLVSLCDEISSVYFCTWQKRLVFISIGRRGYRPNEYTSRHSGHSIKPATSRSSLPFISQRWGSEIEREQMRRKKERQRGERGEVNLRWLDTATVTADRVGLITDRASGQGYSLSAHIGSTTTSLEFVLSLSVSASPYPFCPIHKSEKAFSRLMRVLSPILPLTTPNRHIA